MGEGEYHDDEEYYYDEDDEEFEQHPSSSLRPSSSQPSSSQPSSSQPASSVQSPQSPPHPPKSPSRPTSSPPSRSPRYEPSEEWARIKAGQVSWASETVKDWFDDDGLDGNDVYAGEEEYAEEYDEDEQVRNREVGDYPAGKTAHRQ